MGVFGNTNHGEIEAWISTKSGDDFYGIVEFEWDDYSAPSEATITGIFDIAKDADGEYTTELDRSKNHKDDISASQERSIRDEIASRHCEEEERHWRKEREAEDRALSRHY